MPIYEYRCTECDHRFEILQRLGEGAEELTCPGCGVPRLEKMFSTFAATTQGSPGGRLPCGSTAESAGYCQGADT